jgi:hypothetical protein
LVQYIRDLPGQAQQLHDVPALGIEERPGEGQADAGQFVQHEAERLDAGRGDVQSSLQPLSQSRQAEQDGPLGAAELEAGRMGAALRPGQDAAAKVASLAAASGMPGGCGTS